MVRKQVEGVHTESGCGKNANENLPINWEEIAKWSVENGCPETDGETGQRDYNESRNNDPDIDWCAIAESFMREDAAGNNSNTCDPEELNCSVRAHNASIDIAPEFSRAGYEHGTIPSNYGNQSQRENDCSIRSSRRARHSERSRPISIHESYFDKPSCEGIPTLPSHDYSFMDEDFMHGSTREYQSDIVSFLEKRAGAIKPESIAEGYHFPGRAYTTGQTNCSPRLYTSTPKKGHRSTRAETFEMPDGSGMFNVTFEECLDFGRKLKHFSDVRDCNGCQIMYMDREMNEASDGTKHRVDVSRRWLDFEE